MVTFPIGSVKSGNGYVKFPDGTLIQWGEKEIPAVNETQQGDTAIVFPITLSTTDYVITLTNVYAYYNSILWSVSAKTKTGCRAYFLKSSGNVSASTTIKFMWTVIGRWK